MKSENLVVDRMDYGDGLQIEEGDEHMERDKLLDHLDPLLIGAGGMAALEAIETSGNAMQDYVESTCPNDGRTCRLDVITDPETARLWAQADADLEASLTGLPLDIADLLRAVGQLRLQTQATVEPNAQLDGPEQARQRAIDRRDLSAVRIVVTDE